MASKTGGAVKQKVALYLAHHIFLPPKLPQQDDYEPYLDLALITSILDGLVAFKECLPEARRGQLDNAIAMLRTMQAVHLSGDINEAVLLETLQNLEPNASIPLHIRAQNAGVLITWVQDDIRFDAFELLAENEAVMSIKGRLRRAFPGASVVIGATDFEQDDFLTAVAQTLSNMSSHAVVGMQPQAKKAGELHAEDRDTTHSGMVSELFMGFLRSIGVATASPTISKNTRDEVLWDDTRSPWHRSATWLLIRVSLQLTFNRTSGSGDLYKEAMVFIMGQVLKSVLKLSLPSDMLYAMNAKLAQRLLKIDSRIDNMTLQYLDGTMQDAHKIICDRWSIIQQQDSPSLDPSQLALLDFDKDTRISLPSLDKYIDSMARRQAGVVLTDFVPTSELIIFQSDKLPTLTGAGFSTDTFAIANLQAFEAWVASHCRTWSRAHSGEPAHVMLFSH